MEVVHIIYEKNYSSVTTLPRRQIQILIYFQNFMDENLFQNFNIKLWKACEELSFSSR